MKKYGQKSSEWKRVLTWKTSRVAMAGLLAASLLSGCSGQTVQTAKTGDGSANTSTAATAKAGSEEGSAVENVAGGWELVGDDTSMAAHTEAQDALEKAVADLDGATYEPIALLGTQVVAGTNYCILCRVTPVVPDAEGSYALVYVYEGLDGTCELVNTEDLDVAGGYDYDKAAQVIDNANADAADGSAAGN